MTNVPYVTLNNGNKIAQIGLGTWKSPPGEASNVVYLAIKNGYRHIDCAYLYKNESEPNLSLIAMAFKQVDDTLHPESDGKIELDETVDLIDTWRAFEEVQKAGLVRSIGVSNFNESQVQRILDVCEIKPVINQLEVHPYLNQDPLIAFCKRNDIQVVSYCSLGSTPMTKNISHSRNLTMNCPRLLDDPVVNEIAKNHGKSAAQVLIRYHIEKDLIVIPKTKSEERLKQNLQVFDFKLSKEEMNRLDSLDRIYRFCSFDLYGISDHKEYPWKAELDTNRSRDQYSSD